MLIMHRSLNIWCWLIYWIFQLVTQERRLSTTASRTMAAMSLGFIVVVTPWTIQEVVAACTGSRAPPALDFLATWLALSNSFWNPFIYWLLNNHFRRISRELLVSMVSTNVWSLNTLYTDFSVTKQLFSCLYLVVYCQLYNNASKWKLDVI